MFRAQQCAPAPVERRPRTYYQVLGISPDEQDPQVIEEAALHCSCRARAYQLSHEAGCTLRLNEIARALSTLLDPVRRREYARSLGSLRLRAAPERRPPHRETTTLGEYTFSPLSGEGKACDVKLVYRGRALRQPIRQTG